MHKTHDGKVIASLTEVKNKTGDIFALVDEFGEILLTSYNKPRYRILKISMDEVMELDRRPEVVDVPKVEVKKAPKLNEVPKNVVSEPAPKVETKPEPVKVEEKQLLSTETLIKLSKIKVWERDNKDERLFVKRSLIPLQ